MQCLRNEAVDPLEMRLECGDEGEKEGEMMLLKLPSISPSSNQLVYPSASLARGSRLLN